jgi:hypothetical protein
MRYYIPKERCRDHFWLKTGADGIPRRAEVWEDEASVAEKHPELYTDGDTIIAYSYLPNHKGEIVPVIYANYCYPVMRETSLGGEIDVFYDFIHEPSIPELDMPYYYDSTIEMIDSETGLSEQFDKWYFGDTL